LDAAADLEALERDVSKADAAWLKVAQTVSRQRKQLVPRMARDVTEAMQALGMAGGRFEVGLSELPEPASHGLENIEFLVAGHAGSTPRPLGKVASGGELSRLALAIAVTTTQRGHEAGAQVGTLIFDEIDSGVGGQVADTVGQLMQKLGTTHQVLAVTHLAQVAAHAHQHLLVSKALHDGKTTSAIHPVDGDERTREVARMLGGSATDTSRAHAAAMLTQAHAAPAGINANTTRKGKSAKQGQEVA
jgi:DNA repair protein RecN (Recombination protein N)